MWVWVLLGVFQACTGFAVAPKRFRATLRSDAASVRVPPAASAAAPSDTLGDQVLTLWRFTRPHTFIGTALCVPALHLLAADSLGAVLTQQWARSVAVALIPALFMNVFITGLNQLFDVEIDRINKPELPVASGKLSWAGGATACAVSLALGLTLGEFLPGTSDALKVALYGSAALGAAYSVPPLRLKRSPLLAAVCIVAVRGTLVNACFYRHAVASAFATGARSYAEARLNWVVAFFGAFGIAIALMKDVPDVEGDARNEIKTLSTALGQQKVFDVAAALVTTVLAVASAAFFGGAFVADQRRRAVCRGAVALALGALVRDSRTSTSQVDATSQPEVKAAYMRLWRIFYSCYVLLPFAR
ncbi:UbiA prenyltransferase family-domain-containing protein [Pelagophyceae sp. CCMP2097]|nr:UbiA prenyltransferase family-domain-containing protein [Pelagophyceae sp. CCMP2097]